MNYNRNPPRDPQLPTGESGEWIPQRGLLALIPISGNHGYIASLEEFLEEAKHLTGVHRLKADAKRELLTITMQHSETVSQYYRRIFKLWQHAETPADERIEKFIRTLRPIFSNPLLGRKYTDIKLLLDEARNRC